MTDIHTDAAHLLAKLERALAILVDVKGGHDDGELDRVQNEFQEIFFKIARSPISDPYQFKILQMSLAYLLMEAPEPFDGSFEDAIDVGLREAIDQADSPLQTGILALVRYLMEEQRHAAA